MPVDEFGREIPAISQRDESPPPYRSSSRQRERGESPYFERRSRAGSSDHHLHHHHHPSPLLPPPGSGSSSQHHEWRSPTRRRRSPSPRSQRLQRSKPLDAACRYADEPMLCEYVWKSQKEGEEGREDREVAETDDNSEANEPQTYEEYRRRYCLNYVRSFFNQHLDDFWFRTRYSPLGRRRLALEERDRAAKEAAILREQMEKSLQEKGETTERCSFVRNARLAGGFKASTSAPISRKRKHGDTSSAYQQQQRLVPKSHVISIAQRTLAIQEVPPHVTDEQLCIAIMLNCPKDIKGEGISMYSSSVSVDNKKPLFRDAFCVFETEEMKTDVLNNIIKLYTDANSNRAAPLPDDGIHVPRKDDIGIPDALPLDVECSDPYGREYIDADGKGGQPEDGTGVVLKRKSTVMVVTQSPLHQPILVLSAAVSSRERIGRDKEAAIMLARALDVSRSIPKDNRLDGLLEMLFAGEEQQASSSATGSRNDSSAPSLEEDMLDVAIAYLRRVHLFCFYNGCSFAQRVADVLSGRHPAGTIHMRLHNADEILGNAREDAEVMYGDLSNSNTSGDHEAAKPAVDLLVKRLDDSIERALEESNQWVAQAGSYVIDESTDEQAAEIEEAEVRAKEEWLDAHCLADDGRARCAFHFCRKLFKDDGFLRKHLLKKHVEFLRAAEAQAHDEYMMRAWDQEEHRPVPPIMVDCGAGFGLVPSPVIGVDPVAADPEPELWQKEEERRKRMQAGSGGDLHASSQQAPYQERGRHNKGGGDDEPAAPRPGPRVNNFVDVDDMKEEKVEINFDDIVVDLQPPKKKKKKKLL